MTMMVDCSLSTGRSHIQLLIVLLLALIVVILAPWVLGVALAGAVAYGAYLAIIGVVVALIIATIGLNGKIKALIFRRRLESRIQEGNKLFREREAARQKANKPDDGTTG